MRRLITSTAVALVGLALAGCADGDKKGDDASPPPSSGSKAATAQPAAAQPKPAPAQPKPAPAQPKPAEPEPAPEAVVIEGSRHKDSSGASGSSSDSSRNSRIEELNAKAKASQGKDNGTPVKASGAEAATTNDQKKEQLKAEIADKDAQIAKLEEEKKAMTTTEAHREGRMKREEKKVSDPERAKAIDAEIETLKKDKADLQTKLTALEGK